MNKKYLQVICNTCTEQDAQVDFDFLRQDDDFVVLKCPVCGTEIMYDDIEAGKIEVMNWLFKNNKMLYRKILSDYFSPILNLD